MLTYDMDQRGEESLYAYLYDCMRADIENGSIAAGEKLPSKRKLADHLGVSIVTVEGAYRQLIAEGYVESYFKLECSRPYEGGRCRTRGYLHA